MTTDIARMETNALAALDAGNDALARLAQWVEAASNAHQLVAPLIDTPFVPEAYRPKIDPRATPEQKAEARAVAIASGTAAVLQGITLGLDPLTALQQIYIVHGRPGMYTEMKVALVKAHGHEVWTEDLTDTRAVVCGRRKGTDYSERVTLTMDQARKAGWTSNQAYAKTPQDMLYARAAGRVCDRIAPDVLLGIASVEEIQDTIRAEAQTGPSTRTVTPRRRAAVALPAAVVEDPPLDEWNVHAAATPAVSGKPAAADAASATQDPPLAEDIPDEAKPTGNDLKRLWGRMKPHGLHNADLALGWIGQTIGRDVASRDELTRADLGVLTAALDQLDNPPLDDDARGGDEP